MKVSLPVFVHTQHPKQLFSFPPEMFGVAFGFSAVVYWILVKVWIDVSMFGASLFFIASLILIKWKVGNDRHVGLLWSMGVSWRLRYRRGRLSAGGR